MKKNNCTPISIIIHNEDKDQGIMKLSKINLEYADYIYFKNMIRIIEVEEDSLQRNCLQAAAGVAKVVLKLIGLKYNVVGQFSTRSNVL